MSTPFVNPYAAAAPPSLQDEPPQPLPSPARTQRRLSVATEPEPDLIEIKRFEETSEEVSGMESREDPLGDLDPELIKFIQKHNRRWERAINNIDRTVESRL